MPAHLLPFLGVVAVITVLPGPDMALATRNAVRGGSRAAWWTGVGFLTGLVVWAVASIVGLAAVIAASGRLFDAVRLAGALYLVVLGLGALRSAITGRDGGASRMRLAADDPGAAPPPASRLGYWRQGVTSNLLNPKIALLFLTLLPQFVTAGEPRTETTAELALVFLVIATVWWATFSLAVGALGRALARPAVRRTIEGVAGAVLVGLALRVAVER